MRVARRAPRGRRTDMPGASAHPDPLRRDLQGIRAARDHAGGRLGRRCLAGLSAQAEFAERIRAGWREAGRAGSPQLHASVNFAIGDHDVASRGHQYLARYYGFMPLYADLNIADMLAT